MKIILGQSGVYMPYVSLVGRPLPELKDLEVELSAADASGKMILVCFWDINQRPSRRCIIQLAKQAQQLRQEGVTVVAAQTSKVDEDTFNQWVKNYNIPFPVGIIQSYVEKIRFAWGVRSLPWLILTNRQHVVTAEDFGLNELNEKIKEAAISSTQKQNTDGHAEPSNVKQRSLQLNSESAAFPQDLSPRGGGTKNILYFKMLLWW